MPPAALARPAIVTDPIRVMVVDDSVVSRGMIGRWIDEDPSLAVVASHRNGRTAVADVGRVDPDVVILDVEMPEMDGLTALPLLLASKPGLPVLMASSLTRRGAKTTLEALSRGAADFITKPESRSGADLDGFRRDVVEKVRALGTTRRRQCGRPLTTQRGPAAPAAGLPAPPREPAAAAPLRGAVRVRPRVLAIGASTGGPQALCALLGSAADALRGVAVLVVQHMPAGFTHLFAEQLGRATQRPAAEAADGDEIVPGRILVAPGGRHMLVDPAGQRVVLSDAAPVHHCRPAVDPLFASAAKAFGAATLGLVLTGMGSDGADGARHIAEAGGTVLVQDEATSVVWGMPGAVVAAGLASEVLPLPELGRRTAELVRGAPR